MDTIIQVEQEHSQRSSKKIITSTSLKDDSNEEIQAVLNKDPRLMFSQRIQTN